jgi:hypothetical protein
MFRFEHCRAFAIHGMWSGELREGTLGIGNAGKAAEYTHYAEHCVETAKILPNQEDRSLHREMAAEWLRLAQLISEEKAP